MAVRMVPHGRRGWASMAGKRYAILNAQISQPRNLIVPTILSRDYEFAYTEGVRTVQITMQVPMFAASGNLFGNGLEQAFIDFLFQRVDNLAEYRISDTTESEVKIFDGINVFTFAGVRVNRVSLSIQKGQILVWNLEMLGIQMNAGMHPTDEERFAAWDALPTPRSFRDVQFVIRPATGANPQWEVCKTPVYNADFTIMHNLALNMPITNDLGENIPGAARIDAGPPAAMVNATFQAYLTNRTSPDSQIGSLKQDLADLKTLLDDNAGFGIRINTAAQPAPGASASFTNYLSILFPRVIAENREDSAAQFGQQFRTLRFRCLGNPNNNDAAQEYTLYYPYIYSFT